MTPVLRTQTPVVLKSGGNTGQQAPGHVESTPPGEPWPTRVSRGGQESVRPRRNSCSRREGEPIGCWSVRGEFAHVLHMLWRRPHQR
eukprot:1195448-Prorocentrum_minimum.AAC.4